MTRSTGVARDLGLRADGVRGRRPIAALMPLARARVGLYKPWTASMDEGWTRYLFDQYRIPVPQPRRRGHPEGQPARAVRRHRPARHRTAGDRQRAAERDRCRPSTSAASATEGVAALQGVRRRRAARWCASTRPASSPSRRLNLPVKDVVRGVPADEFFCPGSIAPTRRRPASRSRSACRPRPAASSRRARSYEMDWSKPGADRVRLVARYAAKDVLMSGWLEGEGRIAGRGGGGRGTVRRRAASS